MRNDAQTQPERNLLDSPTHSEARPATPPRALTRSVNRAKVAALLILVAATCWVVANWASVWLVPPYLGLMTLLLWPAPSATRRSGAGRRSKPAPGATAGSDRTEPDGDSAPAATSSDPAALASTAGSADGGVPQPTGDTGPATAMAQPKRGRGRPRKVSKPIAEPVEVAAATWVEVGPGKFVRAEGPTAVGPVPGPDSLVEPEPVPATDDGSMTEVVAPSPGPEAEPAGSAPVAEPGSSVSLDFIFRYHPGAFLVPNLAPEPVPPAADDAVGIPEVVSEAPTSLAEAVSILPAPDVAAAEFSREPAPDAPTADGTAPQVDGSEEPVLAEETRSDDPATGLDFEDFNDDACWPSTEPVEPRGFPDLDPWDASDPTTADSTKTPDASADGFEANWEPEEHFGLAATAEDRASALDLVEIDQADRRADHAGFATASRDNLDATSTERDAAIRVGSVRRSFRLAQAFRPVRVGADRGHGGSVPPGRSGWPARSTRRPIDPRRPPGRRVGRPRQITRTSPPRSPPSSRLFR